MLESLSHVLARVFREDLTAVASGGGMEVFIPTAEKRIEEKMKLDRFYLPPNSSFDYIYSKIEEDNIGEEINKALHRIEDALGCEVDLLTVNSLRNPYFCRRVLKEKVNIYGG